jgi:alpha-maltose-1-phosphate synthase
LADRDDQQTSMRIIGLVEGDPSTALSGVARFLFDALNRRFSVVRRVDYSAHGPLWMALAAATFRPSRGAWRARFHTSRLSHRTLSWVLARRLADLEEDFDLALQVHGWVQGQPHPYALFVDQTRLMAERGWPQWLPFTQRERTELLALERAMYEDAFHVFVMGKPAQHSLVADYGMDPMRISVVGGGPGFDALPAPRNLSADPTVMFVGRDFERKGGDCLLRAFERARRELPAATLHIVGPSDRFDQAGVISHGRISDRRQLSELYGAARVFCLPSRYEPYGLALIEAMAHRVPCIGTSIEAIPEILDRGRAGVLVPPDDPEPLAHALLRLLTDYELAQSVASAGRLRVEQELTWDHVAERMASVLSGVRPTAV